MTALRSARAQMALALFLLVAIAQVAHAAPLTVSFTAPTQFYAHSVNRVRAWSSTWATGDRGERITLDCGQDVAVTPADGFCLDRPNAVAFDFLVQTGAVSDGAPCTFTLHQNADSPFYEPLAASSTAKVPVVEQVGLSVLPAGAAASTREKPHVVVAGTSFELHFAPSTDLAQPVTAQLECKGLVDSVSHEEVTLHQTSAPANSTLVLASYPGLAECNLVLPATPAANPLAAPKSIYLQVVAQPQLVATGTIAARGIMAEPLAPNTKYTLSVAPPTIPMAFTLALKCAGVEAASAIFVETDTAAKDFEFTTGAAPSAGDGSVMCQWTGSGADWDSSQLALPADFSYFLAKDLTVTVSAALTSLGGANPLTTTVTLSLPAGAVSTHLVLTSSCTSGTLIGGEGSLFGFMGYEGLDGVGTYTAAPLADTASTAVCTFTPVMDYWDFSPDSRRIQNPAPITLTFNVAAAAEPAPAKEQLVLKGLPTTADTISTPIVPGLVTLTGNAGSAVVTVSRPQGLAADTNIKLTLTCSSTFGATATVAPAFVDFTPATQTDPAAEFSIALTGPTQAGTIHARVDCSWSTADSTQSEVDKRTMPINFNFVIGTPVQLEVTLMDVSTDYPLSALPLGAQSDIVLWSAGDPQVRVTNTWQIYVHCASCASSGVQGEVHAGVDDRAFDETFNGLEGSATGVAVGSVTCHWSFRDPEGGARGYILPADTQINVVPRVMLEPTLTLSPGAEPIVMPRIERSKYMHAHGPVASGAQVTVTLPAVPAGDFGGATNTFLLMCEDAVSGDAITTLTSDGIFVVSSGSGAQSVTITMPTLVDEQPRQLACSWNWDEEYGTGPWFVRDARGDAPAFQIMVVSTPVALSIVAPPADTAVAGGQVSVLFEPSRTVQLAGSHLRVRVACVSSVPMDSLSMSNLGLGQMGTYPTTSNPRSQLTPTSFVFELQSSDSDNTLTAGATDPALQFGYKLNLPSAATTLSCSHSLVKSTPENQGTAERQLTLNAPQPVVINVRAKQSITVSGVPTATLPAAPEDPFISVKPSAFAAGLTLEVALTCQGLDTSAPVTFTGAGAAEIEAQTLEVALMTVEAPHLGYRWLCSLTLGGSAASLFDTPPGFAIEVGALQTWSIQRPERPAPIYTTATSSDLYRITDQVLVTSGCIPVGAQIQTVCDHDAHLYFGTDSYPAMPYTLRADDQRLPLMLRTKHVGTTTCKLQLLDLPAGFPLRPLADVSFEVTSPGFVAVGGLQPSPIVGDGIHYAVYAGVTTAEVPVTPNVPAPAGGLTVELSCQGEYDLMLRLLYWPEGAMHTQSILLGSMPKMVALDYQCSWYANHKAYRSMDAQKFMFLDQVPARFVVDGADAEGLVSSPDACSDIELSVSVTDAKVPVYPIKVYFYCPDIGLNVVANLNRDDQTIPFRLAAPNVATTTTCVLSADNQMISVYPFRVSWGSVPTVSIDMPSFVVRGSSVPFDITASAPLPFSDDLRLEGECSFGTIPWGDWTPTLSGGASSVRSVYNATNEPVEDVDPFFSLDGNALTAKGVQRSLVAPIRAVAPRRKAHSGRGRMGRSLLALASPAPVTAVGDQTVPSEPVFCDWTTKSSLATRFVIPKRSTFIVGTPVALTAAVDGTAVDGTPVPQGSSAAVVIASSTPVAVDVAFTVTCPTGVSVTPSTFTLSPSSAEGQTVTVAVAADAPLGAATCTLTPEGAGRMAVVGPVAVSFNVVAPSPDGTTADASTADGTGADGSTAGSGVDPCADAQCGAFTSASLPGLVACVAMLLVAAFGQRQ